MKHALLPIVAIFFFLSCDEQQKKVVEAEKPFTNADACLFSEIAYCNNPQPQLDKYTPGWKVVWNAVALNGNHAFIASDGSKYVLSIRGSLMEFSWDAFENWIYQDLNIVSQDKWSYTTSGSDAKVSTGSYRGFQNLIKLKDKDSGKDILGFFQENVKEETPVIITGHSLGGNLATVLASYLSFKLKEINHPAKNMNVITFAAPAAGNAAFAKDFNEKFPQSIRIENEGDIVPKFPCTSAIASLAKLYASSPSAAEITVGYNNMSVPLSTVFKGMSTIVSGLQLASGFSSFTQTNGDGTIIKVKLSGKNLTNDISSWFAEAGYQHSVAQYAASMGAPVIEECNAVVK
ncbi:MAG: hypothetical protein WDN26_20440 [Chitinophagaceae bacterium]